MRRPPTSGKARYDAKTGRSDGKNSPEAIRRHGERMIFGRNRDKGLVQIGMKLMVVRIGEGGVTEEDILIHNAHEPNPGVHMMLVNMRYPNYPVALGVIRDVPDHTYDDNIVDQLEEIRAKSNIHCVDDLLRSGETWEIR